MAKLECRIARGALPHERSLVVEGIDRQYEAWAEASQVLTSEIIGDAEVFGHVVVSVLEEDLGRNKVLVQIPGEVIMGGRRLWVRADKVSP